MASERELTAYHEAGHLVVAHHHGHPVWGVSLVSEGESAGRCYISLHVDGSEPPTAGKLLADLDVLLAGVVAEEGRVGGPAGDGWRYGDLDRAVAVARHWALLAGRSEVAEALRADPAAFLLREFAPAPRRLLARPALWRRVEGLAEQLLVRETLEGEDLTRLLASLARPSEPPPPACRPFWASPVAALARRAGRLID